MSGNTVIEWTDRRIADLVNNLRDIAIKFHGAGQLRERIAHLVVPLLKSNPAPAEVNSQTGAQESREVKPAPRNHDIMRRVDGAWQHKTVTLSCCIFCQSDELIVSDVERDGYEPEDWQSAVHCGGCGARGPWGRTEQRAVEKWNQACGIETISLTGWISPPPVHPVLDDGDFPF